MAKKPPEKIHKHHAARTLDVCPCGATRVNGGEWEEGKDPAAVALAAKAIAMSTPEERHAKAKSGGEERWRDKTAKQRSQFMRWMAKQPRPGRRVQDRCPCGRYSVAYAAARNHRCTAPEAQDAR